jgi:hypothetical protein
MIGYRVAQKNILGTLKTLSDCRISYAPMRVESLWSWL